jgi:hypothetical protein
MQDFMTLEGEWRFRLDPDAQGEGQEWFNDQLPDRVQLPGSLDENGIGDLVEGKDPHRLSRIVEYTGCAWYQKDVEIPKEAKNKHLVLILERCHWESTLWVDGIKIGSQDSLCVAHEYDLSDLLTPGRHQMTMRIDNRIKYNVGKDAHSITKETQTNWNGVIGKLGLQITDPVFIEDVQIYPDLVANTIRVETTIKNKTKRTIQGQLILNDNKTTDIMISDKEMHLEVSCDMDNLSERWDEFCPNMHSLTTAIKTPDYYHEKITSFGMRQVTTQGRQFAMNGQKTFLRGTLECCVFPLTGHPPMDYVAWDKIFTKAKAYGLNHIRFHSWCPPEIAFQVADEVGIYLQIETPVWTELGEDALLDQFVYDEADRIMKAYGNHPSFCMLAVGNEPSGDDYETFLNTIVGHWKKKDRRRLYTGCAGWPEIEANEYHCLKNRGHVLRCQDWGDELEGRLNKNPLKTDFDFQTLIEDSPVPVVSHEIGQWCAYPNFKEMEKYTGVLKPLNFELAAESLQKAGLENQGQAFMLASGKWQSLLYKEEIEAALRTPGFGGFQLLGLTDFPGQGTALVGMLDAFWEEKGYLNQKQFHEFCCETVPLLRMKKVVWQASETFVGKVQISHFGAKSMEDAYVTWSVRDKSGDLITTGSFDPRTIAITNENYVGHISFDLDRIQKAGEFIITLAIEGTFYENSWSIWVYPEIKTLLPNHVKLVNQEDAAIQYLKEGKSVILIPQEAEDEADKIPAGFTTIFWNTQWTEGQAPHTLGISCDPAHPALSHFVTDDHTNWQWFDLIHDANIQRLKAEDSEVDPIIYVIDDWNTNRKLSLLYEKKHSYGEGKLLICGMNLQGDLENRPVAKQMLHSIIEYVR